MQRIFLFLVTNIAVLAVFGIVLRIFGVESLLDERGVNLEYRSLLIYAAALGFGGALVSLALSKWTAKRLTGARVIQTARTAEEKWLLETVARQAREAGIGTPEVAIYDAPDMNAFATGARRNHALVAVSVGLLRKMKKEEVEAVLAHEVSHVANGDMITLALLQGVINTFVIALSRIIGHVVDRVLLKNRHGHGPGFWITAIIAELILAVLASIIVMWFSRRREFRADAGGAKLAGRSAMIAALQRLKTTARGPHLPDQMAAFGISGALGGGVKKLFMTHPPLDARIAALREWDGR